MRIRKRSEPKHGTGAEYVVYGCRCRDCKDAWNAIQRHYRKKGSIGKNLTHGTASSYLAGCRCADCTQAHVDCNREYYRALAREKRGMKEAV